MAQHPDPSKNPPLTAASPTSHWLRALRRQTGGALSASFRRMGSGYSVGPQGALMAARDLVVGLSGGMDTDRAATLFGMTTAIQHDMILRAALDHGRLDILDLMWMAHRQDKLPDQLMHLMLVGAMRWERVELAIEILDVLRRGAANGPQSAARMWSWAVSPLLNINPSLTMWTAVLKTVGQVAPPGTGTLLKLASKRGEAQLLRALQAWEGVITLNDIPSYSTLAQVADGDALRILAYKSNGQAAAGMLAEFALRRMMAGPEHVAEKTVVFDGFLRNPRLAQDRSVDSILAAALCECAGHSDQLAVRSLIKLGANSDQALLTLVPSRMMLGQYDVPIVETLAPFVQQETLRQVSRKSPLLTGAVGALKALALQEVLEEAVDCGGGETNTVPSISAVKQRPHKM